MKYTPYNPKDSTRRQRKASRKATFEANKSLHTSRKKKENAA